MLREIIEEVELKEADGGYGDLGVIPTAPNPGLKKGKEKPKNPKEKEKKGVLIIDNSKE